MGQFAESFVKPTSEAWTGVEVVRRAVPRLPKISTKQLIGVVQGGGQLPPNFQGGNKGAVSERNMMRQQQPADMQIIKSYGTSKSRSKGDGFCYYYNNKRPMNRNV